ncbi:hypothetical protein NC652_005365 [Populus alba x Populus x berolinensis]|nr:hypothetical protein NC652_005365 [Populus alba x Populus x berolinensis]
MFDYGCVQVLSEDRNHCMVQGLAVRLRVATLLAVFAVKALSGPMRRWGRFGVNQAIKAIWGPTPRIPIQTTSVF